MEEKKEQLLELKKSIDYHKNRIIRISKYPKSESNKVTLNRAYKIVMNMLRMNALKVQAQMIISQPIPIFNDGGVSAMVGEKENEHIIMSNDKTIELLKPKQNDKRNIQLIGNLGSFRTKKDTIKRQ